MLSAELVDECGRLIEDVRAGKKRPHELYAWNDRCLVDDMLSEEGNAFAQHYFAFDKGNYLADYAKTLQRDLPSEFHVSYSDDNYRLLAAVIDRRYSEWRSRKS
jgi:hypothetical protein